VLGLFKDDEQLSALAPSCLPRWNSAIIRSCRVNVFSPRAICCSTSLRRRSIVARFIRVSHEPSINRDRSPRDSHNDRGCQPQSTHKSAKPEGAVSGELVSLADLPELWRLPLRRGNILHSPDEVLKPIQEPDKKPSGNEGHLCKRPFHSVNLLQEQTDRYVLSISAQLIAIRAVLAIISERLMCSTVRDDHLHTPRSQRTTSTAIGSSAKSAAKPVAPGSSRCGGRPFELTVERH
jgi:hypothetical protein